MKKLVSAEPFLHLHLYQDWMRGSVWEGWQGCEAVWWCVAHWTFGTGAKVSTRGLHMSATLAGHYIVWFSVSLSPTLTIFVFYRLITPTSSTCSPFPHSLPPSASPSSQSVFPSLCLSQLKLYGSFTAFFLWNNEQGASERLCSWATVLCVWML